MIYKVLIERSAKRTLTKISKPHQDRIINAIGRLRDDPRPPGVQKLTGRLAWRIRVGNYRIIYEIDDDRMTVLIVTLGHRGEVYRYGR